MRFDERMVEQRAAVMRLVQEGILREREATGDPVAWVFRQQEDAAGYMLLLRQVVTTRGIPAAVYQNCHFIFEISKRVRSSLEEDLTGTRFPTQVGRLLLELGVESIPAYSPQAKGRVERHWRTQQDRLVAELRLAGVQTIEEANTFLPSYLERYRARFAVAPRSAESAYVPIGPETDLNRLFCFKYQRKVAADNTIRFAGQVIQIPPGPDRLSYARVVVEVHERLDGSIAVYSRGRQLVLVPAPTHPPTLRSRGHQHRALQDGPVPKAGTDSSLTWSEVLRRARAAREGPPATENGRPTSQHPWRRAMHAAPTQAQKR